MTILRQFLAHLLEHDDRLSQAGVARRAGLSQSVVNKIACGSGGQDSDSETYRKLADTFPMQWRAFLSERPDACSALARRYAWAMTAVALDVHTAVIFTRQETVPRGRGMSFLDERLAPA